MNYLHSAAAQAFNALLNPSDHALTYTAIKDLETALKPPQATSNDLHDAVGKALKIWQSDDITDYFEKVSEVMNLLHNAYVQNNDNLDAARHRWLTKYTAQLFMCTPEQVNEQIDKAMKGGI